MLLLPSPRQSTHSSFTTPLLLYFFKQAAFSSLFLVSLSPAQQIQRLLFTAAYCLFELAI
jgi:hypothetical protein